MLKLRGVVEAVIFLSAAAAEGAVNDVEAAVSAGAVESFCWRNCCCCRN
jgi:hypothetical protein